MFIEKKGFTLAEILITLSVIGVIAALTIPVLTKNFEEAQNKTRFKKVFSNISQAVQMILSENNGTLNGKFETRNFHKTFCNYLKCTKTCENISSTDIRELGCWHAQGSSYYLNRTVEDTGMQDGVVLQDGTLIGFYDRSANDGDKLCDNESGDYNNICGWAYVDVNGFRGPNTFGKDMFLIFILENRAAPAGVSQSWHYQHACDYNSYGYGCAAKVLKNEDY